MSWFLFALICLLGWGFADMFYKKSSDDDDKYSHLKIAVWVGLVMGVCAIICAAKVSSHYKAGRLEKASRMSERAALFVILSIVAWLIWIPFSVVFAML